MTGSPRRQEPSGTRRAAALLALVVALGSAGAGIADPPACTPTYAEPCELVYGGGPVRVAAASSRAAAGLGPVFPVPLVRFPVFRIELRAPSGVVLAACTTSLLSGGACQHSTVPALEPGTVLLCVVTEAGASDVGRPVGVTAGTCTTGV